MAEDKSHHLPGNRIKEKIKTNKGSKHNCTKILPDSSSEIKTFNINKQYS